VNQLLDDLKSFTLSIAICMSMFISGTNWASHSDICIIPNHESKLLQVSLTLFMGKRDHVRSQNYFISLTLFDE